MSNNADTGRKINLMPMCFYFLMVDFRIDWKEKNVTLNYERHNFIYLHIINIKLYFNDLYVIIY